MKKRTKQPRHIAKGHFGNHAEAVVAHGYSIVAMKPRTKKPRYRKWTAACYKHTDLDWLYRHASKFPDDTLAIACGTKTIAVDIDIDDEPQAELVHQIARDTLGDTPLVRFGREPRRALLYRPIEMTRTIRAGKIEVLGTGSTVIAYGLHPQTGGSYRWRDASPADTPPEHLPAVSGSDIERFLNRACQAMGRNARGPVADAPNDHVATLSPSRAPRHRPASALADRIKFNDAGIAVDGREAYLAHIIARLFYGGVSTPDELAQLAWEEFASSADLTRPKGSGAARWSRRDAMSKAKEIIRRQPKGRARRHKGRPPARDLHLYRKPGYWTEDRKARHQAIAVRRAVRASELVVNKCMLDGIPLQAGQCELTIAELVRLTKLSERAVKLARRQLLDVGLWFAERGVYVPLPLDDVESE
jgi:hypothetical protein